MTPNLCRPPYPARPPARPVPSRLATVSHRSFPHMAASGSCLALVMACLVECELESFSCRPKGGIGLAAQTSPPPRPTPSVYRSQPLSRRGMGCAGLLSSVTASPQATALALPHKQLHGLMGKLRGEELVLFRKLSRVVLSIKHRFNLPVSWHNYYFIHH